MTSTDAVERPPLDDPSWWSALPACPTQVASVERAADPGAAGATSVIERIRLRFADAAMPDAHLVVKAGRGGFAGMGLAAPPPQWRVEADFYLSRAGSLPITVPRCWHAAVSADGSDGVLVLEDLRPEQPWLEPIEPNDVAAAIDVAASMHAATWGEPLPWAPQGGLLLATASEPMPDVWSHLRPSVASERVATYDALMPLLGDLAATTLAMARCLVHGDLAPRNLLHDASGNLAVIDFGTACSSIGGIDVSRLVMSCAELAGSPDAHREAAERWRRALVAHGVNAPDACDAWDGYRLGMALNAQYGAMQEAAPWAQGPRAESYRRGAVLMHAALVACSIPEFARDWLR